MPTNVNKTIITITFNPAIDKCVSVDHLAAEHKMSTSEPIYHPGGGGVNIVRALRKLGYPASAVYFEGGNTGVFFSTLLSQEQVTAIPIRISGDTRENFIVNERKTQKQFRFGLPGPRINKSELKALLDRLNEFDGIDYLVVSGSLSPGISPKVFETLKALSDSKSAKLFVDTSGEALKTALSYGVYLIKPSLKELASLVGKNRLSAPQGIKAARRLIESSHCEVVVLSLGGRGAVLLTRDITLEIEAPKVKVVSTVGAGDSLLAGILISLAQGRLLSEAFRYGIACGSAATIEPGTSLCDKKVADALLEVILSRK